MKVYFIIINSEIITLHNCHINLICLYRLCLQNVNVVLLSIKLNCQHIYLLQIEKSITCCDENMIIKLIIITALRTRVQSRILPVIWFTTVVIRYIQTNWHHIKEHFSCTLEITAPGPSPSLAVTSPSAPGRAEKSSVKIQNEIAYISSFFPSNTQLFTFESSS